MRSALRLRVDEVAMRVPPARSGGSAVVSCRCSRTHSMMAAACRCAAISATRTFDSWPLPASRADTERRIWQWRHLMEYFLIKRYQACIDALQGGSDAVGGRPAALQRRLPGWQPLRAEPNPMSAACTTWRLCLLSRYSMHNDFAYTKACRELPVAQKIGRTALLTIWCCRRREHEGVRRYAHREAVQRQLLVDDGGLLCAPAGLSAHGQGLPRCDCTYRAGSGP